MERGGRGSGERRRNATVTMITAARLTRAPGARMRLTWLHHCPSVTPPPQSLRTNMADDEEIPCVRFTARDFVALADFELKKRVLPAIAALRESSLFDQIERLVQ